MIEATISAGQSATGMINYIKGETGATYTPNVSEDGVLSWTNDRGLENPEAVNIKGQKGDAYILTDEDKKEVTETILKEVTTDELISSVTETREELERVKNEVLETGEVSGSSVYLGDSAMAEIQELKIDGKSVQNGEPTPDAPIEIESAGTYNETTGKYEIEVKTVGKNLFDKNKATTQVGYFSADGTLNSGGSSTITTNYTKIIPNEDITVSGFLVNRIVYYDENFNFIERGETITTTPYTFNKNAHYIRIQGVTDIFNLDKLQIETGNVATEYEPYQEQTTLIALNEPLRSLPNGVKDIAYIKNNKLYVDRYVGNYNYSENDRFTLTTNSSTGEVFFKNTTISNYIKKWGKGISSHFIFNDKAYSDTSINNAIFVGGGGYDLYFKITDVATVEDFKTWLSNNNVQVDYELATPITEEIGLADMFITYDEVTNIFTSENLQPNITVKYYRNFEKTIQNLQVNEKALKQELIDINSRLSILEASLINEVESDIESEVIE